MGARLTMIAMLLVEFLFSLPHPAALDAESELVVQEALDNILGQEKITTIIIAHRLSTIRNADKIHVIARGKVVEEGTHQELMAGDSYYRKLVLKQEGHDNTGSDPPSRNASSANLAELENEQGMELATGGRYHSPHLSFNHVTFAYPTRPKKKVLDKFSLTIEKGTSVALVGPSGGGKSTTVGLIERFYDTDEGEVLVRVQYNFVLEPNFGLGQLTLSLVLFLCTVHGSECQGT
jgi:ATP-binding cassette, subfamily B (MDR/TAP), member 1